MTTQELLSQLSKLNIKLWVDGERLRFRAPQGVMTPELQAKLVLHKAELIARLAEHASTTGNASVAAEQGIVTGLVPLAPNQRWYFEQNFPNPHHFNLAPLFEVDQRLRLEPALVKEVIKHLLIQHDACRLRFIKKGAEWLQFLSAPDENVPFSFIDLSALSEDEQTRAVETEAGKVQTTLNISKGPIFQVILFDLGPHRPSRLLFSMHHLVIDAFSNTFLMEDFMTAYEQLSLGESVRLPAKTTSFKQWSKHLVAYAHSSAVQQELGYWQARPDEQLPAILPPDTRSGAFIIASIYRVQGELTVEQTQALMQDVLRTYDMQLIEVMLAVMAETIGQVTGDRSLYVDVLRQGRGIPLQGIDISRTVGWCVIHYPLWLKLAGVTSLVEALPQVKEQYRRPIDGGIGYDLLRYMSGDEEIKKTLLPRPSILFSHESLQPSQSAALIRPAREQVGNSMDLLVEWPYRLELRTVIAADQLQWSWTTGATVYQRSTIEKLSQSFGQVLGSLCSREPVGKP